MNNDLISREALKKKLQARHDNGEEEFDKGYNIGIETAIDLIDNAPAVEALLTNEEIKDFAKENFENGYEMAKHKYGEWVPIKYEKLTKAEQEDLAEKNGEPVECYEGSWRYACPLPEDGQEVLVTTKFWGYWSITTFHRDEDGAEHFEEYDDEGDLLAWMPLPEPYKTKEASHDKY